jgi:hypothetical protein
MGNNVTGATAEIHADTSLWSALHTSEVLGQTGFLHVGSLLLRFGTYGDVASAVAAVDHLAAGVADLRALLVAVLPEPLTPDAGDHHVRATS